MVAMKQLELELLSHTAIPMQSHHEREIPRADVQMPKLPIDDVWHALARTRINEVPRMSVAVSNCQSPWINKPEPRTKRRIEHVFQFHAIRDRKILAEIVN